MCDNFYLYIVYLLFQSINEQWTPTFKLIFNPLMNTKHPLSSSAGKIWLPTIEKTIFRKKVSFTVNMILTFFHEFWRNEAPLSIRICVGSEIYVVLFNKFVDGLFWVLEWEYILMEERKLWLFAFYPIMIFKLKSTVTEPPHGLVSCDTITNISRQRSLDVIIESVNFLKADHYVVCMGCLFYATDILRHWFLWVLWPVGPVPVWAFRIQICHYFVRIWIWISTLISTFCDFFLTFIYDNWCNCTIKY